MPGGVLDVARVHRQVRLELASAVLVAPGVVERDTPLPQLRRRARPRPRHLVEPVGRLLDPPSAEVRHRPVEDLLRRLRARAADPETAALDPDPEYLRGIKMLCLRLGLPIGYLGVSNQFVGTESELRDQVDMCKESVDLAAFIGAPLIRVFGGHVPPEIEARREIRDIEDLLRTAATEGDQPRRLQRRLRWLETKLRESRRGRALLSDPHYANAIRQRLTQDNEYTP